MLDTFTTVPRLSLRYGSAVPTKVIALATALQVLISLADNCSDGIHLSAGYDLASWCVY